MRVRFWGTRGSKPGARIRIHGCHDVLEQAFRLQMLKETIRLEKLTRTRQPLKITAAYDGMEIEL